MRDAEKDLALCEAATPGPWQTSPDGRYSLAIVSLPAQEVICFTDSFGKGARDGQYIAEAREALPYWIQRAAAAEAEIDRLRKALEQIMETPKDWSETYDKAYGACIRIASKALAEAGS